MRAKLTDLRISEGTKFLCGKKVGSHYIQGLVDVKSDDSYDSALLQLTKKWESLDSSEDGPIHTFTEWFHRFKSDMVKKCMLRLVRQQAGLECPPDAFTTNANESVNALLKNKYKRHELPMFLDKL